MFHMIWLWLQYPGSFEIDSTKDHFTSKRIQDSLGLQYTAPFR